MKFTFAAPQITAVQPESSLPLTSNLRVWMYFADPNWQTSPRQTIEHFTARVSPPNFPTTHFGNHWLIRQLANLILPLTKPRSPRQRLLPAPTSCGDNRRMRLPIEIRKPVDTFHDEFQRSRIRSNELFEGPRAICLRSRWARVSRLTRLPRNEQVSQ